MKNPRVRDQGKANFEANKNGTGVGLLIELDGRSTIPQTYKASKNKRLVVLNVDINLKISY